MPELHSVSLQSKSTPCRVETLEYSDPGCTFRFLWQKHQCPSHPTNCTNNFPAIKQLQIVTVLSSPRQQRSSGRSPCISGFATRLLSSPVVQVVRRCEEVWELPSSAISFDSIRCLRFSVQMKSTVPADGQVFV